MKYFISILLFFFSVIGLAQDFNQKLSKYDRNNNYDMIHYYLDISVDMDKKVIGGHAHLKLVPTTATDSITLDAENMKIFSISNFGKPVNFTHSERKLNLRFEKAFSQKDTLDLVIHYACNSGNSKGVKYFSPNPDTPDYNYQMWTQGQEELNHFWFPCYDFPNDRVTSEIKVTVNEDLETVSNGKLINFTHDKENKTKTFHWLQDKQHVTYLVSLVVGKYSIVNDKSEKLPLPCYVYPGMETDAKAIFSQTRDMIRFFEKVTGTKYPWDKYSQTILYDFFGGMENTSATNLIDAIPDRRQLKFDEKYSRFYTTLIAHELAHMWYGDLITCSNWSHLWLNEGFAEFLPGLYFENIYGKTASDEYYISELQSYLFINSKERMPVAERESNNIYPKGALILKMLRSMLGDNVFLKALKEYTASYKNRPVTTADFQKSLEKSTGKSFDTFFKQWIYKAGHPILKIKYEYDKKLKQLNLNIEQAQKIDSLTGLFETELEVELVYPKNNITKSIFIKEKSDKFTINGVKEPLTINFDPQVKIIREIEVEKPLSSYLYQLKYNKNLSPRIEAAQKLKSFCDSGVVVETIENCLKIEKSSIVRSELVKTLKNCRNERAIKILMDAFKDEYPSVRKDILFSLSSYKNNKKVSEFIAAALNDSSFTVIASAIQNLVTVDSIEALDKIIKFIDTPSYRNTIQEHALGALIKMRTSKAIPVFKKYAFSGYSQLARNSGLLGLTTMAKTNPDLYDFFVEQLNHKSSYFRRMSAGALADIGNKNAIEILEKMDITETSSYVKSSIKAALKKLKDK